MRVPTPEQIKNLKIQEAKSFVIDQVITKGLVSGVHIDAPGDLEEVLEFFRSIIEAGWEMTLMTPPNRDKLIAFCVSPAPANFNIAEHILYVTKTICGAYNGGVIPDTIVETVSKETAEKFLSGVKQRSPLCTVTGQDIQELVSNLVQKFPVLNDSIKDEILVTINRHIGEVTKQFSEGECKELPLEPLPEKDLDLVMDTPPSPTPPDKEY